MINLHRLTFNSFQVNTYILSDETDSCIIIDPSCYSEQEEIMLSNFISENNLKPVLNINTHCHIDHILGMEYVRNKYSIPTWINELELKLLENGPLMGEIFGFRVEPLDRPEHFIEDREIIQFGNSEIQAIHVPGHSAGSLAFYGKEEAFVITGDALFAGSIGRTDLPGGDYDTLIESIGENLFTLPVKTTVWPGHGEETTIEKEIRSNPFFNNYKT